MSEKHKETLILDAKKNLRDLVAVCGHRTGQGYHLRALLYSLWNGQPASLLKVTRLDGDLKLKFCIVVLAFGTSGFFYDEVKDAFVEAGLFDWFVEEGEAI